MLEDRGGRGGSRSVSGSGPAAERTLTADGPAEVTFAPMAHALYWVSSKLSALDVGERFSSRTLGVVLFLELFASVDVFERQLVPPENLRVLRVVKLVSGWGWLQNSTTGVLHLFWLLMRYSFVLHLVFRLDTSDRVICWILILQWEHKTNPRVTVLVLHEWFLSYYFILRMPLKWFCKKKNKVADFIKYGLKLKRKLEEVRLIYLVQ